MSSVTLYTLSRLNYLRFHETHKYKFVVTWLGAKLGSNKEIESYK